MSGFEKVWANPDDSFVLDLDVVQRRLEERMSSSPLFAPLSEYLTELLQGFSADSLMREYYDHQRMELASQAGTAQSEALKYMRAGDLGMFITMFYEEGSIFLATSQMAEQNFSDAADLMENPGSMLLKSASIEVPNISSLLWTVREDLDFSTGLGLPEPDAIRLPPSIENEFGQYL
ncbi:hypothetical protein CMO88_00435 [Candidatus Woesearchaeota archaeon]|nr:hypothetical protein [Candidatus Woesearchaeota archaeon]|tara:strand:- start:39349 stop:39879 length:531 start_codon:yes stop_codon:yes gene_type:complete